MTDDRKSREQRDSDTRQFTEQEKEILSESPADSPNIVKGGTGDPSAQEAASSDG